MTAGVHSFIQDGFSCHCASEAIMCSSGLGLMCLQPLTMVVQKCVAIVIIVGLYRIVSSLGDRRLVYRAK